MNSVRTRLFLIFAATIAIILLLISALPMISLQGSGITTLPEAIGVGENEQFANPTLLLLLQASFAAWVILIPVWLVYVLKDKRRRTFFILSTIAFLIIFPPIYRELANVQPPKIIQEIEPVASNEDFIPDESEVVAGPETPDFLTNRPGWVTALVTILLLGVFGLVGYMLFRIFYQKPVPELGEISDNIDKAIERIQSHPGNFKNAILQCYADMTVAVSSGKGTARDKGMTPREFESKLVSLGIPNDSVRRLTGMFEQARYGQVSPSQREEMEAIDCLREIQKACKRPKSVATPVAKPVAS